MRYDSEKIYAHFGSVWPPVEAITQNINTNGGEDYLVRRPWVGSTYDIDGEIKEYFEKIAVLGPPSGDDFHDRTVTLSGCDPCLVGDIIKKRTWGQG